MKSIIIFGFIMILLAFFGGRSIEYVNSQECVEKVEALVTKSMKKELRENYNQYLSENKVMVMFYIREDGSLDDVEFWSPGFERYGLKEEAITRHLMKGNYKCLRDRDWPNDEIQDVSILLNGIESGDLLGP